MARGDRGVIMASNLSLCFVLLLLSLLSLLLFLLLLFRKINLVSFSILRNKAHLLHFFYIKVGC